MAEDLWFTRELLNYSQSSLAYQQFFIVEPSKQIDKILAPKVINNTFYNYLLKQAVTGGLCTAFVHGKVDKDTIINEHFNYLNKPKLDGNAWQNFNNLKEWKNSFKENPLGISTIDIRSLYPSASVKKCRFISLYFIQDSQPIIMLNCIQMKNFIKLYILINIARMQKTMVLLRQTLCNL